MIIFPIYFTPKEAEMRNFFAILALLILTACGSNQPTVAPEQAGASVVSSIPITDSDVNATTQVTATESAVIEITETPRPSGYSFDGALSFNADDTVRAVFFLNRTDQRAVFGSAFVYMMIDGQKPEEAECQLTTQGGQVDCDLPAHFTSLIVKVTDATATGESCSVELPNQVQPDMTKFSLNCAFPIP